MNLNLFQQTNPVSAGNTLVMAIYKASAPTSLIASYPLPLPYTGQTQLYTFTGLQSVVYNYVLYESADAGADGTVINSFSVQPNISSYNTRDPLYLVANTSPYLASNTNFYGPDPSLVGWDWYVEQPGGVGTLQYGVAYQKTVGGTPTTQDDTTADGWVFLQAGFLIGDAQAFVIHFVPQLAATTSISGSIISGTTLLTTNTTLTNSAAGQAFLLQGTAPALGITMPSVNTMPDNEPIFIDSAGGLHINAALLAASGEYFEWYNNSTTPGGGIRPSALYLGQCESIGLYKWTYPDSTRKWIIFQGGEGMRLVGEILYNYSLIPLNTVFANGQLLSRTTYARLWNWIQTSNINLIADSAFNNTTTVNGVTYQSNWGYFTSGDGATTFRVPKLWAYGYLRAKAGVGGSGSGNGFSGDFTAQQVGIHDHVMHGKGPIVGAGFNWFLSLISGRYSAGGGSDKFGGMSGTPDINMRTGNSSNGNTAGENLTSSTGVYALIRS